MNATKPGVVGATIVCRSGVYFDFLDPKPWTIDVEDIAWGLSNACRYAGQCLAFYSVAQHSVLVSRHVPPALALAGLLHDAAEAYMGDIVGPLKQLLPEYKVIERRVEHAIAARFDLPYPWPAEVKHADLRLLRTEQRDLTAGSSDVWSSTDGYEPLDQVIAPMMPDEAFERFLARYAEITR